MASSSQSAAYEELLDRYDRLVNLYYTGNLLGWDQQVMMPEGGTPARARQTSVVQTVYHEHLTDDRTGELLDAVEDADLDDEEAAAVREIRREYERRAGIPDDLVEELSQVEAEAQQVWQDAKADADWAAFQPTLSTVLDLDADRAAHIDPDRDPYEVLYEDRAPYLPLSTVEEVFDDLRESLVPLIDDIRERGDDLAAPFAEYAPYDTDVQEQLSRDALDLLGYPWDRGRLDTAPHPFMSGTQFDARVTTRFREDDPVDALTATIHEFGHATYQLGLPDDAYGSPLGMPRSSGVHESQSRFWENHVGRTRAFWELFLPQVKERFPELEDVTVDEAYEAVNRIYPDNLVRVEADELTYHFHIILRSDVEQAVMNDEIALKEVPEFWNDRIEEYLGVRPDDDAEGCLQDIHWTGGFASFQNYTVGSVLAAQLHAAMVEDLGELDGYIREGEFEPIHEWLTDNVHSHGSRYETPELVEVATGEPLTADYFLDYATEKFTDLYGL